MSEDFEIDIRKYTRWILRSWVWILTLTALAALGGILFSSQKPQNYSASATVIINRSLEVWNFTPAIKYNYNPPTDAALFDLANSESLKKEIYEQLSENDKARISFAAFRSLATVTTGSDKTVLRLGIVLEDPDEAARLANSWASTFIDRVNETFSGYDAAQVTFYEERVRTAQTQLEKINQELVDFHSSSQLQVLTSQTQTLLAERENLQVLQQNLTYLDKIAGSLREQLSQNPADSNLTQTEGLNILVLQLQLFNNHYPRIARGNSDIDISASFSQGITIDNSSFESITVASALNSLDQLVRIIHQQQDWITNRTSDLDNAVVSLQGEVQDLTNQEAVLKQDQSVVSETIMYLSQKEQEVKVAQAYYNTNSITRLSSAAITPSAPLSRQVLTTGLIAGIAGFALGIVGVFLKNWWQETPASQSNSDSN